MRLRTVYQAVAIAASAFVLSGCAALPSPDVSSDDESTMQFSTEAPEAALTLTTRGASTVIDDGDSVLLCTGGVLQMMPPGCVGGVTLHGWEWADVPDLHEAAGVRWGEYSVSGLWDEVTGVLTVTEADPVSKADGAALSTPAADEGFRTPCAPPSGGWLVETAPPTTDAARDAAIAAASAEPGFASAWPGAHDEAPVAVLNVSTAGAVEAMTAAVRAHWGGPLCVSSTARSAADIDRLQQELTEQTTVPVTGVGWGGTTDLYISVSVVYDDGTMQRQLDAQYGDGAVEVFSSLVPAD